MDRVYVKQCFVLRMHTAAGAQWLESGLYTGLDLVRWTARGGRGTLESAGTVLARCEGIDKW